MLDLANAKCVRREDLNSASTSSASASRRSSPAHSTNDAGLQRLKPNSRVEFEEIVVNTHTTSTKDPSQPDDPTSPDLTATQDSDHDSALEFRLFSAPVASTSKLRSTTTNSSSADAATTTTTPAAVARIHLSPPPSSSLSQPLQKRPDSYYFHTPATSDKLDALRAAAVSAEDVRKRAQAPWYGWTMPWRVFRGALAGEAANTSDTSLRTSSGPSDDTRTRRRTRKSKKTRIRLRTKVRKGEEAKVRKEREAAEKEAHVREKKARLNRAKQIKRRARAREGKKAGEEGEGGGSGG